MAIICDLTYNTAVFITFVRSFIVQALGDLAAALFPPCLEKAEEEKKKTGAKDGSQFT